MRRRDVLALVAAAAWPLGARAQQTSKRLAFIHSVAEADLATAPFVAGLKRGLATQGWVDGRNLQIDYRFDASTPQAASRAASELLALKPDAVVAVGVAAQEAAKVTKTTPIVFALVGDPVGLGLVESFARPGGNVTGFTQIDQIAVAKLVELLKELSPGITRACLLVTQPAQAETVSVFQSTAVALGLQPVVVTVATAAEIAPSLSQLASTPGGGLIAGIGFGGTLLLSNRSLLVQEAIRNRIPAVFGHLLFAREGAVTLYIDDFDVIERAGVYAGLILNGLRPPDLPVQAPTKMLLSVNLKAAKATGLIVPLSVLVRADEVIGE